jgi:OmpR-family two-component system manganese-sensing sensor histidine kinase
MFKTTTSKLFLKNFSVIVVLLSVFSFAVYLMVTHNVERADRQRLQSLSDILLGPIDDPNEAEEIKNELVPDVMQSHGFLGDKPDRITLQWFDPKGQLLAAKGTAIITIPFDAAAQFQRDKTSGLLLLTSPAIRDGVLIGYLRVGMKVCQSEKYKRGLITSLLIGITISLAASSFVVLFLVRQTLKPVEESIQKLTDFTADASHELKNPIMAIKSNGAVALQYADGMRETDRTKFLAIIDAADQINVTMTDLLSLAESEHELLNDALTFLKIVDLLDDLNADLKELSAAKSVTLKWLIADGNLVIKGREEDIKLAIGNVIKNAIQYSNPGQEVLITCRNIGNKIVFEITDSGIGISEEDQPKVFDRFWRSNKARTHTYGGNGLGLAIVQSIVKRYKGTIAIRSKLGEGTTFIISIPERR